MIVILKIFTSLIIAMLWYQLTGNQEISIAFLVILLIVFFVRPIPFQDPEQRKQYLEKIKRAHEKKLEIEKQKSDERKRMLMERKKRGLDEE